MIEYNTGERIKDENDSEPTHENEKVQSTISLDSLEKKKKSQWRWKTNRREGVG